MYMNMDNAREGAQREKMRRIAELGICPFCPEHFRDFHDAPVLAENESWLLTKNDFPYEGASEQFLLVLKRHAEHVRDLSAAEWGRLGELSEKAASGSFGGGAFVMRFGDTAFTGGTIAHLHAHVIFGGKDADQGKLKVSVGWNAKKARD